MQGVTSRDQKTLGDPLPASKGPVALPGRAQPWSLVPNQHRCCTKTQGGLFSGTSIAHAESSFCAGQPRKGRKALIIRFHGQSDLLTGGVTWLPCATAVCTHWRVCLYTLGHVCVVGVHPARTSTPTRCDPGPLSSWVQATGKRPLGLFIPHCKHFRAQWPTL